MRKLNGGVFRRFQASPAMKIFAGFRSRWTIFLKALLDPKWSKWFPQSFRQDNNSLVFPTASAFAGSLQYIIGHVGFLSSLWVRSYALRHYKSQALMVELPSWTTMATKASLGFQSSRVSWIESAIMSQSSIFPLNFAHLPGMLDSLAAKMIWGHQIGPWAMPSFLVRLLVVSPHPKEEHILDFRSSCWYHFPAS